MMRLRAGNRHRSGHPRARYRLPQLGLPRRVHDVEAVRCHPDRRSRHVGVAGSAVALGFVPTERGQRAPVGSRVDAAGQPRDHGHACLGQVAAQLDSHADPGGGAPPRADDRHPGTGDDLGRAPVEQDGRGLDVAGQGRWVAGRAEDGDAHALVHDLVPHLGRVDRGGLAPPQSDQCRPLVAERPDDVAVAPAPPITHAAPRLRRPLGPHDGAQPVRPHLREASQAGGEGLIR
jgi:hypothetical protein